MSWARKAVGGVSGVSRQAVSCRLWGLGPLSEPCFVSLQEADDLEQLCLDETGGSFSMQAGELGQE